MKSPARGISPFFRVCSGLFAQPAPNQLNRTRWIRSLATVRFVKIGHPAGMFLRGSPFPAHGRGSGLPSGNRRRNRPPFGDPPESVLGKAGRPGRIASALEFLPASAPGPAASRRSRYRAKGSSPSPARRFPPNAVWAPGGRAARAEGGP